MDAGHFLVEPLNPVYQSLEAEFGFARADTWPGTKRPESLRAGMAPSPSAAHGDPRCLAGDEQMIRQTEKGLIAESNTTTVEFEGAHRLHQIRPAVKNSWIAGEKRPDRLLQSEKSRPRQRPLASGASPHLTGDIAEIVLNDWECDVSARVSIDGRPATSDQANRLDDARQDGRAR
jgi:hypothetical protein